MFKASLKFSKASIEGAVASRGSKSSNIEGLGFVKPPWRIVFASSGSKPSKIEDLGFFKPLWATVVASGRSKSSQK